MRLQAPLSLFVSYFLVSWLRIWVLVALPLARLLTLQAFTQRTNYKQAWKLASLNPCSRIPINYLAGSIPHVHPVQVACLFLFSLSISSIFVGTPPACLSWAVISTAGKIINMGAMFEISSIFNPKSRHPFTHTLRVLWKQYSFIHYWIRSIFPSPYNKNGEVGCFPGSDPNAPHPGYNDSRWWWSPWRTDARSSMLRTDSLPHMGVPKLLERCLGGLGVVILKKCSPYFRKAPYISKMSLTYPHVAQKFTSLWGGTQFVRDQVWKPRAAKKSHTQHHILSKAHR